MSASIGNEENRLILRTGNNLSLSQPENVENTGLTLGSNTNEQSELTLHSNSLGKSPESQEDRNQSNDSNFRLGDDTNQNRLSLEKLPPPSHHSKGYLVQSLSKGMLSVQEDKERRKQTDEVIIQVAAQIKVARQQIDEGVKQFIKITNQFNQATTDHALQLIEKISLGGDLSSQDITHANFLNDLTKQTRNRYYETSTQLMDLDKINSEGKLGNFKDIIELVFNTRMKELTLLTERLKMMHVQENHELAVEESIRNQFLKEQSQQFDHWMKQLRFDSNESQRTCNNH